MEQIHALIGPVSVVGLLFLALRIGSLIRLVRRLVWRSRRRASRRQT